MDLHMSILGSLALEGHWYVFYVTRHQVYWVLTYVFFPCTLIWYLTHIYTHKDTQSTQGPVDLHTHINIYLHQLLCAHRNYLCYIEWIIHWYKKVTFPNIFSLQQSCTCRGNTGISKKTHTHTHTHTHTPNTQIKITLGRVSICSFHLREQSDPSYFSRILKPQPPSPFLFMKGGRGFHIYRIYHKVNLSPVRQSKILEVQVQWFLKIELQNILTVCNAKYLNWIILFLKNIWACFFWK